MRLLSTRRALLQHALPALLVANAPSPNIAMSAAYRSASVEVAGANIPVALWLPPALRNPQTLNGVRALCDFQTCYKSFSSRSARGLDLTIAVMR